MKVIDKFRKWSREGMAWPFVHDPTTKQPSVTLMFFYISFVVAVSYIAVSSGMLIAKGDYLSATLMPTMLLLLGFVFYRLRQLDKVKIDLDDKEIELSSSHGDEEGKDDSSEQNS